MRSLVQNAFLEMRAFRVWVCLPICILFLPRVAPAQWAVNFNNRVPGETISHIYAPKVDNLHLSVIGNGASDLPSGTNDWTGFAPLSGEGYRAALLAAPGASQPDSALTFAPATTTFRTGAAAGYLAGVTVTFTGIPVETPVVTVKVFAWDNRTGLFPNPAEAFHAWKSGYVEAGLSPKINLQTNLLGGAANLSGLQSFNLYHISWHPLMFAPCQNNIQAEGFRFLVSNANGNPYTVQWSTNLQQWFDLRRVEAPSAADEIVDSNLEGAPRKFFRTVQ